ncbi:N-(5'-phosphoribosyl)anthranilate isomerase [Tenacibaculum sp. 190130A14a]|uniref:N-(5'-phosphoribosyl)anthranilate isomerase n=1 Tax=Tenacibaculum polynesiense TaxID=3137857 RepID=A0ABM9PDH5_9FLAO
MKYVENIQQVAELTPDYLGFIFYDRSPRNFEGIIPELPKSIKKVGVFVNEYIEIAVSLIQEYQLDAVQLHGDESVEYIQKLKEAFQTAEEELITQLKKKRKPRNVEVIKVFGVKDEFDFTVLKPYETEVDYFLFDTKGKERGGNGITFNWKVLENYNSETPLFLSGGIGLKEIPEIQKIVNSNLPIHALDVNSKFETKPGVKSVKDLAKFKKELFTN